MISLTLNSIDNANRKIMSKVFDTLKYTKGAIAAGMTVEEAEYQAEQMANLVDQQLVTKNFMAGELKNIELNIIKWTIGISFSQGFLILGILGFLMKH